jgi:hypothetical protein
MKNYFAVRRRTANRNIDVRLPKTHGKEAHCRAPFVKLTAKKYVCRAPLFVTHGKEAHLAKPSRPTMNNPAHHQRQRWDRRSREDQTVQIRQANYINTAPPPPKPYQSNPAAPNPLSSRRPHLYLSFIQPRRRPHLSSHRLPHDDAGGWARIRAAASPLIPPAHEWGSRRRRRPTSF